MHLFSHCTSKNYREESLGNMSDWPGPLVAKPPQCNCVMATHEDHNRSENAVWWEEELGLFLA